MKYYKYKILKIKPMNLKIIINKLETKLIIKVIKKLLISTKNSFFLPIFIYCTIHII